MRHLPTAARYLLGVILFVFGLNGFLSFIPAPAPAPGAGGTFLAALAATGYLMTLVKAVEVAVGVLLLADRFVPFALILFDPTVPGVAVALLMLALEVFLLVAYRRYYAPLTEARATPVAG